MITVKNFGCEGFRAFRDIQQTQDLSARGFFGIRGLNRSTGGSSGAGKSSVAHLLAYLLGYSPFPASKQQSSLTKKPLQAWCTLESPEGTVVLRRGKETSIKVGDEDEISGSVTKVNERLERLFGVGPDLLRNLTYRPQRKPGLFLSLADADKKQFLSKVLGLEDLRKQIQKSVQFSTAMDSAVSSSESALRALESVVVMEPAVPDNFDHCTLGDTTYSRQDLEETVRLVTEDYGGAQTRLNSVIEDERSYRETELIKSTATKEALAQKCRDFDLELNKQMLDLVEPPDSTGTERVQLQKALEFADTRIRDFRINLDKIVTAIGSEKSELKELERKLGGRSAVELLLQQKNQEIEAIRAQECPTCRQSWVQADLGERLTMVEKYKAELLEFDSINARAEVHRDRILESEIRLQDRAELQEFQKARENIVSDVKTLDLRRNQELAEFRTQKSELGRKLAQLSNDFRNQISGDQVNMYQSIQTTLDAFQTGIQEARSKLYGIEKKLDFCRSALSTMEADEKRARDRYQTEFGYYKKYRLELESAQTKYRGALIEKNREADFVSLLKGFLGSIFSEILDEIGEEANALMQGLPNVSTTTITFNTEKEKSDGSFDATITPIVTRGGNVMDLEANLSGGQLAAVELAVDLAVSRVVQRRTGSAPGWLVLDEAFTGFDPVVTENCLALLAKAGADLQIFVIDHSTEIKDFFTNTINVVSENDISRIEA